jgi:sugar lactone lactonase YvrE
MKVGNIRRNMKNHVCHSKLVMTLLFFILQIIFFSVGSNGSTDIWKVKNHEDFLEGSPKGTAVSSDGTVTLSPLLDSLFQTGELYIWSLATDGKTVYAGTGNDGKIFKVTQDGKGKVFARLEDEVEVLSLALDRNGYLYAGTGPEGKIFKISPQGEVQLFFKSDESYIWTMKFHPNGLLYAGTGENGKIVGVTPEGKGSVLYDSDEDHILALYIHGQRIVAGTSKSGLLFEISTDGKARVLYDTFQEEVRSIVIDQDGNIWFGATTPEEKSGELSIYRIKSTGDEAYSVINLPYLLLTMTMDPSGNLLVGTGEESLLEVNPEGEWKLLLEIPETQVLQLLPLGGQIIMGTGNLGNLYKIRARFRKEGDYVSKVHDAITFSQWGLIQWEGENISDTKISLQTRSGNTEKANGTWSEWSKFYDSKKSSQGAMKIESPPARFLQWRARLRTKHPKLSPVLKEVKVAFLQKNLPPRIQSITLYPAGVGVGKQIGKPKFPSLPQKRREELKRQGFELPPGTFILEKGFQSVGWKGEDENGDSLVYDLYFRGVGENRWKILKDKVPQENRVFDTRAFPDGRYEIRVVAWDSPDNPENHVLSGEKVSEVFTVDNTPPRVEKIQAKSISQGTYSITFEVEDETSTLRECSYALDGQDWKPLYPSDDVFDTSSEYFEFRTKNLSKGEHILVIKAEDSQENIGAGKIILK